MSTPSNISKLIASESASYIIPIDGAKEFLEDASKNYIGRKTLQKNLQDSINKARKKRGAFLVGGYPGVGKTLLVDRALAAVNKDYDTLMVKINLGVDIKITTQEIYEDVAEILASEFRQHFVWPLIPRVLLHRFTWVVGIIAVLMIVLSGFMIYTAWWKVSIGLMIIPPLVTGLWWLLNHKLWSIDGDFVKILEDIHYKKNMDFSAKVGTKNSNLGVSVGLKKKSPISSRRIEQQLINILKKLHGREFGGKPLSVCIILDELDKVSGDLKGRSHTSGDSRKSMVNTLLAGMKGFTTSAKGIFIFIAGREMVDAYHSESGNTTALYEGMFDEIFYVPTLLTDSSDGKPLELHSNVRQYISNLISGEFDESAGLKNVIRSKYSECPKKLIGEHEIEYENFIYITKIFISYLTLRSFGNSKRLVSLVKQFIDTKDEGEGDEDKYITLGTKRGLPEGHFLKFTPENIAHFSVSAKIYSYLESSLGRELAAADDKLVVSSIVTLLDLVKFHSIGFSRQHLDRTLERIDIHAEAHLPHITDQLLNSALFSVLRQTDESLYDYRFVSLIEEEIRHVSKTTGARASTFEFSLDSAEPIKHHFKQQLDEFYTIEDSSRSSLQAIAHIEMLLGDLEFWERSYDEAFIHYSVAVQTLKRILRMPDGNTWRTDESWSYSSHYLLMKILLKKGLSEEMRANSGLATGYYEEAMSIAGLSIKDGNKVALKDYFESELGIALSQEESKNVPMRRNKMFLHCVLAMAFNDLKHGLGPDDNSVYGIEPRQILLAELPPWKQGKNTSYYSKIALVQFYAGMHDKLATILEEVPKAKNREQKELPFLQLIQAQNTVFQKIEALAGVIGKSSSNKGVTAWLTFIKAVNCSLNAITNGAEANPQQTWSDINTLITTGCKGDADTIEFVTALYLIHRASKDLESLGLYQRSAQFNLFIISNYIVLLELVPWRMVNINNWPHIGANDWLARLHTQCIENIRVSNDGNFYKERLKNTAAMQAVDNITELTEALKGTRKPNILSTYFFWHRSSLENFTFLLTMWVRFAENEISKKATFSGSNGFSIQKIMPPLTDSPRISAVYWWLIGRGLQQELSHLPSLGSGLNWNSVKDLKTLEEVKTVKSVKAANKKVYEILNSLKGCIHVFCKALTASKNTGIGESASSLPPTELLLYNLYECLILAKEKLKTDENVGMLVYKWEFSEESEYISPLLCDTEHLRIALRRYFADARDIRNSASNASKRRLRHKYYLFDDLADPISFLDWTFTNMLSFGANLHLAQVEELSSKRVT